MTDGRYGNASEVIRGEISGPASEAEQLGIKLADDLLARGAKAILAALYQSADT